MSIPSRARILGRPFAGSLTMLALALALAAPASALDKTARNMENIQLVEFDDLQSRPLSFFNSVVRFRCTFAENTDVFDVLRTKFRPDTHYAIAVWDDRAHLYDPEVRAGVLMSLYLNKDRFSPQQVAGLAGKKYQILELAGEVTSVVDGIPQIEVVELRPVSNAGAWTEQAIYHVEQARLLGEEAPDLAEAHFVEALADNLPLAGRTDIALLRGRLLLSSGAFAQAEKVMSAAIEDCQYDRTLPEISRAELYALLARSRAELAERGTGGYQAAVDSAQKSLAMDPANGGAYAVLGISLAGLGKYDEARRACDNAVRLRPSDAEVRWYLGRILDLQGRSDEAIDALKKAIDLTPKDHRIHQAIALAYQHRGVRTKSAVDLATAVQEFDIALRLNANSVALLLGSGQALEDAAVAGVEVRSGSGRVPATLDMALLRYQQAVVADAKSVPAQIALGVVLAKLGKGDEARAAITTVEGLGGNAAPIKQALDKGAVKVPAAP